MQVETGKICLGPRITLWLCQQFAIENGPVEIVDFPINSTVILTIFFCMFTRGEHPC